MTFGTWPTDANEMWCGSQFDRGRQGGSEQYHGSTGQNGSEHDRGDIPRFRHPRVPDASGRRQDERPTYRLVLPHGSGL